MATKKTKMTRFAPKFHIKKGDRVQVISGNNKGEKGEVLEMFPDKSRAIVDNVNMVKKHRKPTQNNPGGIVDIAASIHISNLMLLDPKTGEPTRIGRKVVDGKLVRYAKKSGELFN